MLKQSNNLLGKPPDNKEQAIDFAHKISTLFMFCIFSIHPLFYLLTCHIIPSNPSSELLLYTK